MVIATVSETHRLLAAYSEEGDSRAREQLVDNYVPLVRSLCRRFRRSRESQEDLFQIGVIGLLNAIEKFDPRYGTSFSSIAIPEVLGAILNYLRDHSSFLKVPRALRRNKLKVNRRSEMLAAHLGRWPTVAELVRECDLPENDIRAALEFARTGEPSSLDERLGASDVDGATTLSDLIGYEDGGFERSLDQMTLAAALNTLPLREKTIVTLRFYQEMSQKRIAERLDISQMHVSRLERSALLKLRLFMQDDASGADSLEPDSYSPTSGLPAAS